MLVLGLLLVAVSALALVAALTGGSNDPATFDLGIFDIQTTTLGVFVIGAATVLVFVTGLVLTRSGVRRAGRHRVEKKELHRLSERYTNEKDEERTESTENSPDPDPDPEQPQA